ncbi:unnamed protein product [Didymodactylos carnosus]|uniref:FLYWCH-type domain-containing protein n=1 Tax=Didymodactylos carnosus TaxID=1234261 RepID=A0A814I7Z6_9BILA|nr:unnamed protein product [Didymodactylos carnosus]CAF3791387.1 unnamed protein product [Didymodactylos carnosus]
MYVVYIRNIIKSKIEYVQSTHGKTHGKTHVCYEGFRCYCHHKNDDDLKYWKCVKKSCRVGLTIKPNGTIKKRADHVVESSLPIDAIVDQTYAGLQNSTVCQDVVVQLPSIATMRNNLQKERRKTVPPLPKNITELPHPIPINYQKSLNGE